MMTAQLARSYSPAETEPEVLARWEAAGANHAEPGDPGDPYSIVIPPPNVTAALHMGHALNNTLQDVLVRYHRMRGFNTLWMPGTDHAGIATQTVVEKRLLQEGRRRADLGREAFVARVQEWKDEYEATIIEQLKAMGCSCDWRRVRFTMDEVCARAVREAFFRLFSEGLVYRGKRLVNWDPVTRTALADDEVEMREVDGRMWYLRYPLVEGEGFVVVATTRPETMLGDTAVAINPNDPRAAALAGRRVRLPIVDREVPIITDDYVVLPGREDRADNPMAEYATGFLKVTPAHDPNDWEIGVRHGLEVINVLAPDATVSADHGWSEQETPSAEAARLLGLPREEARQAVVEWFRAHGLLDGVRDYRHSVGHSYRSHVPIEPYLSDQWYVRVTDDRLRGEALRALADDQHEGAGPQRAGAATSPGDGGLTFFPARYARTYQLWHENLRDWCISRQLWWGHRIPVWHGPPAGSDRLAALEAEGRIATAPHEGGLYVCVRDDDGDLTAEIESLGFEQDPDVLDTWFSSGLWPISTMGWPRPADFPATLGLLETFNPSSVLVTARDIITLWVSRMVMFNRHFRAGKLPFRHVYINPMIQDGHGQRMSKSLGNGVDPRDIIHSHGADAMRFALAQMATSTQDVRLPVEMLCPHCSAAFAPLETTSPIGYRVAAPRQECPACGKAMVSAYGAASGLERPDKAAPLARNTARKFDAGRNFANKLWNATRFALGALESAGDGDGPGAGRGEPALMDRWMLSRLRRTLGAFEDAIDRYEFNLCADLMYELVWRDFCDWYLESIKPTVRSDPAQQRVLRTVLEAILRMVHPVCPFVTEALWAHVGPPGAAPLTTGPWPDAGAGPDDEEALETVLRLQGLTGAIRNLRGEHNVPPKRKVRLCATPRARALVDAGGGVVETLAGLAAVADAAMKEPGAVTLAFEGEELFVDGLADAVDVESQRSRLDKLCAEKERAVESLGRKLANPHYVSKAPPHVVEETRARLAEAQADLAAARRALAGLEPR